MRVSWVLLISVVLFGCPSADLQNTDPSEYESRDANTDPLDDPVADPDSELPDGGEPTDAEVGTGLADGTDGQETDSEDVDSDSDGRQPEDVGDAADDSQEDAPTEDVADITEDQDGPDDPPDDTPNDTPDVIEDLTDDSTKLDLTGDSDDGDLPDTGEDVAPDLVLDGTDTQGDSDPDTSTPDTADAGDDPAPDVVDTGEDPEPEVDVTDDPEPDLPDACADVSCETPPADFCSGPEYLTVYEATGQCAAGRCEYDSTPHWCSNGCGTREGDDQCNVECQPSDPCCTDGGEYRGDDVRCGATPVDSRFSCEGSACGSDALVERQYAYCTGNESGCGASNLVWEAPTLLDACGAGQLCVASPLTATCEACDGGDAGGACSECAIDDHCEKGNYCDGGACRACDSDAHCGTACQDCTETGATCSDQGVCVECDGSSGCGLGSWCDNGTCSTCDVNDHCTLFCFRCGSFPFDDEQPVCGGFWDGCVCTETSCAEPWEACDGTSCTICHEDNSCGVSCGACSGSTPGCVDLGDWSRCEECRTDAHCDSGLVCDVDHECVGPQSCSGPPLDACYDGIGFGESCEDAIIIDREDAADGARRTGDLTNARDNDSSCTNATGGDLFYRVFMMAGETLTVHMDVDSFDGFDPVVSIHRATAECVGAGCDIEVVCEDDGGDGSDVRTTPYVAPASGWYVIQADAWRDVDSSEEDGSFILNVDLTCLEAGCGC